MSGSTPRKFGLTVGPAFLVVAGVLLWRTHAAAAAVAGGLGAALIVAAMVVPRALAPVERGWMRFAHAISTVTTPIVMGVVYFVVLAPIGLVMRAAGKDPLRQAPANQSGWVPREQEQGRRGGMNRQF